MTSALLRALLVLIFFTISLKSVSDTEKVRPFECGFIPKSNSRFFFSLQFFLVTIVFLIFDVELVLIFPVLGELFYSADPLIDSGLLMFIFILTIGLA
jgi:NADH-ubiquinone oxidoreductase chain 3